MHEPTMSTTVRFSQFGAAIAFGVADTSLFGVTTPIVMGTIAAIMQKNKIPSLSMRRLAQHVNEEIKLILRKVGAAKRPSGYALYCWQTPSRASTRRSISALVRLKWLVNLMVCAALQNSD